MLDIADVEDLAIGLVIIGVNGNEAISLRTVN
jgi:hypothetical protein